jgi:hypothetical protein
MAIAKDNAVPVTHRPEAVTGDPGVDDIPSNEVGLDFGATPVTEHDFSRGRERAKS